MTARRIRTTPAGPDAAVSTVVGGPGGYRRRPCAECPWRVDAAGKWPAEAFRVSAHTAYDMAREQFGCHETSTAPATCAGFLLSGAAHNLSVRLRRMRGETLDVSSDVPLHGSYREMAVANGVDPDDPALRPCR